jgi:hypothetical protein
MRRIGMADGKPDSPESKAGGNRGRRRPGPTIDLKATEVAATEPVDAAKDSAPESAPAEVVVAPERAETSAGEPESETTANADAPADTVSADEPAQKTSEPDAEIPPPPPPSAGRVWPMLGAAVGGGVVVAIAMLLLLLLWGIPPRGGEANRQATQLATLESSVRDLAGRIPAAATDVNKVASLTERVGKLEAAGNAPRPPPADPAFAGKVAEAEKQVAALTRELAALKQRADTNAAAAEAAQRTAAAAAAKAETVQAADAQGAAVDRRELSGLGGRLTKLESAAQALQAEIAQQKSALAQQQAAVAKQGELQRNQRAVRLAMVAELLKATVANGERFRRELDAAKALAPNKAPLAPLEAFADTGIPSATVLAQQLQAALPSMRRAAAPKAATGGGFLDRLQINAERLVRIQPIEEKQGDDVGAMLTRIDAKARRGDIAGILAELKTLPPAVRAPAESWIKTAQSREAAIEASRRFAAAHVGALAGRTE